jgi:N-acetylmuramoyl-L-alanine amidase
MKRMIAVVTILLGILGFSLNGIAGSQLRVLDLRLLSTTSNTTQVILDLSEPAHYQLFTLPAERGKPYRVVLDLQNTRLIAPLEQPQQHPLIRAIRSGEQAQGRHLRVVIDLHHRAEARAVMLPPSGQYGHRLALTLDSGTQKTAALAPAPVIHAPQATTAATYYPPALPTVAPPPRVPEVFASGYPTQPLVGTKRPLIIAVDAGHGGVDPGAIGPSGVKEKNITLAIARELAAHINREAGMRAVLIREGDYFLSLRERIERARHNKADIFISLHADSYQDNSNVKGASVFMLSQRGASSEAAKWLAERENGADLLGGVSAVSLKDKSDVLASILLDLSQTGTLEASADLGAHVLSSLAAIGPVNHKKVQQAAFMVLRSPDIPSILVETAFISNPHEERKLTIPAEQQKIARAIVAGLKNYFYQHAPPGTVLAQRN